MADGDISTPGEAASLAGVTLPKGEPDIETLRSRYRAASEEFRREALKGPRESGEAARKLHAAKNALRLAQESRG